MLWLDSTRYATVRCGEQLRLSPFFRKFTQITENYRGDVLFFRNVISRFSFVCGDRGVTWSL